MPELPKDDPKKKEVEFDGLLEEGVDAVIDQSNGAPQIWEDDDMKNFYEGLGLNFINLYFSCKIYREKFILVDLRPIVPAILYKDTLQAKKSVDSVTESKSQEQSDKPVGEEDIEDEDLDDVIDNEEVSPPDIEGDFA